MTAIRRSTATAPRCLAEQRSPKSLRSAGLSACRFLPVASHGNSSVF
jgi:hypothetical protein